MPTYDDNSQPSTSGLKNVTAARKSIAARPAPSNNGLRDAHVTKTRRSVLPVSSKVQQSIKKQTTRTGGAIANLSTVKNSPRRQSIRNKPTKATSSPIKARRTSFKIYSPLAAVGRQRKSIGRKEQQAKSLIPMAKTGKNDGGLFLKPKPSLKCEICHKIFRLQSNLLQHRKIHDKDTATNECKFCDKKFAIKGALLTHQQKNCTKIPFDERKKLQSPQRKQTKRTTKPYYESTLSPANETTADSLFSSDSSSSLSLSMASGTVSSARSASTKKMAHSGIYRTPSKPITCGTCKITLPDLFSFTTHAEQHSNESMNLPRNSFEGKKLF